MSAEVEAGGCNAPGLLADDVLAIDDRCVVELRSGSTRPGAAVCGVCGRTWDDSVSTAVTPAPGGRCPYEATHDEVLGMDAAQLDAQDVVAALSDALELAEVWLVDGGTGTIDDRLALYAILRDWQKRGGRLATIVADVEQSIVGDLDTPRQVDGQWWRAKRKASRKGYDKDGLRSAVNREAFAPRRSVDPISGEVLGDRTPSTAEVVDTIWQAADVATGRTKVLRETFGIDLDEYAHTEWSTVLEPVDFADLTPEQQAEGITT